MLNKINFGFIRALVRRDLWKYFTNPTGYVFITLFIFMSAAAAFWQDRFFLNNLANLSQLNQVFPYLLLFFVPALTMGVWSEEKKQGTDELLFTLPASGLEVVLGKYVATLGIYTASLLLSLSHVLVLLWLASPDLGMILGNYVGYWLVGAALIAVGMLASLLTANATIAFILGALLCAALVVFDAVGGAVSNWLGSLTAPLTVAGPFGDFAKGVISFSGILYFCSVTVIALYLNILVVEKRHWPREAGGFPMWLHQWVRVIALVVAVISANVVISRLGMRLDVTSERLHSLSSETRRLVSELDPDRPVFIQAYISPDTPEPYVQTRANLLSMLDELDKAGGSSVQVIIRDVEPFTEGAREAREKFGIVPRQIPDTSNARAGLSDVFMGVAVTCGAEEEVIPFLDRGLPAEYELARSIRVAARTERKKIGVLDTPLRLFGGLDFQTFRNTPSWPVVDELRKQYEVVQLAPQALESEEVDMLLVALPSTLAQEEMDQLLDYIQSGKPALLLVDPLPIINLGLAPSERSGANTNPFMRNQGPPPKEKGNIQALMRQLGVTWNSAAIIWDSYNPHPDLAYLPPEVVFVGRGSGNPASFNSEHQATGSLQELVLLYPGYMEKAAESGRDFQPLVTSGDASGSFRYFDMVQRSIFGVQLNQRLRHHPDGREYVLAAHITKAAAGADENADESEDDSEDVPEPSPGDEDSSGGINVIVVADVDFISEQFFQIRERGPQNLNFDNVTFFLNCADILMKDESFIELRNKRVRHRTLTRVEQQTSDFIAARVQQEGEAEAEAEKALSDAQRRLQERVADVNQRTDLDARTKQIMARNLQESENRKFEVLKANIEAEKEAKISSAKEETEARVRSIQSNIRTLAVMLPPIPVFVLGVLIFVRRQRREREGELAARRLRA